MFTINIDLLIINVLKLEVNLPLQPKYFLRKINCISQFAKIFLESSTINLSFVCGLKWLSMRFLQRHELYFEKVFNLKQALFFEDGTSSLQFENAHAESVEKNAPKCI